MTSSFSLSQNRRRWTNYAMHGLVIGATALALTPLVLIFIYLIMKGAGALNWDFFTQPVGSGDGVANAILGTATLVGLASCIGIPVGLLSGLYLSEYGRTTKFGTILRFFTDVLNSTPSIVVGVFGFAFIVIPTKHFSALAGAVALSILMIPIITRSTEEIALLVPNSLREAGLALGLPRWRVILWIVARTARAGIVTGILLSVARVAGESAPLLLTALGNLWWNRNLNEPIAALPVQIYNYATSPFPKLWDQAWGAALVLVGLVALTSLLARVISHREQLR
ncbi:phosphate ABC transporter permease PstA [Candidatus Acetothermia bacterium]|nr:phosphate ABC transporter permease PstA [Candidatus Acetothermia bacterium]